MSCWNCLTPFKKGFEYCLECDANIRAYCYTCYVPIYATRTDDINMIYQDDLTIPVGRPICESCYDLLKDKIPKHLNYLKRKYTALYHGQELKKKSALKPKRIGLEKWIWNGIKRSDWVNYFFNSWNFFSKSSSI